MTYRVQLHLQPSYPLQHIGQHQPVRSLCSSNSTLLTVPPTRTVTAARAFCISAPTVRNSLQYAVKETSLQPQFFRRLKGHLFQRVFGWLWPPAVPLYCCRNWQWIYGTAYKPRNRLLNLSKLTYKKPKSRWTVSLILYIHHTQHSTPQIKIFILSLFSSMLFSYECVVHRPLLELTVTVWRQYVRSIYMRCGQTR